MQRYTVFFIIVNALHVSGGFSAHHRELKNCAHSIGYLSSLLAATASGKICNKNLCCIQLTFYFHILTTMHGQNHIKSKQSQRLQKIFPFVFIKSVFILAILGFIATRHLSKHAWRCERHPECHRSRSQWI